MTYEEYLDEVTTLITEKYNLSDAAAIKLVVKAQDAEFFVQHDEKDAMRTLDRTPRRYLWPARRNKGLRQCEIELSQARPARGPYREQCRLTIIDLC
jgi:hypothetical protein